jgi:DNA-binding transcriptional regulator PaaX
MSWKKYKYYFRKPKSEIVKDILIALSSLGVFWIAASSPYFWHKLFKEIRKKQKIKKNYPNKEVSNTFYSLKRRKLINIERKGYQIYISLTEEGKKRAKWLQIDALKIKKPKKWDKKWRLVIFDIAQMKKIYREAIRGKLKQLGFHPLQKSVWICPYNCQAEFELLKEFFGFSDKEFRLIVTDEIGETKTLKKIFHLTEGQF